MNSYYTDRKMSVIIRQNKGSRRKHKVSQLYTPFRYDFVGSFLRPEYLKKARADYEAGAMSAEELKKTEDKAITELVAKQKEAGYHVITDGEFRRATWHLDFMWAFDGVGHSKTETGLPFHGEAAMIDDTYVTGKISYKKNHSFVEHFKFVKALEDENTVAKLTIPAPAQFLEQMIMPFAWSNTKKFYDTQEEVYNAFFKELDESIEVLTENRNAALVASADFVYSGNVQKWVKFANSLKLRLAIRIANVSPAKAKEMAESAVNHELGLIETNADNATWKYFGTISNPLFVAVRYNEEASGGDTHPAADIICYMNGYNDNRRASYFEESKWPGETYVGLRRGINLSKMKEYFINYSRVKISSSDPVLWMNAAEVAFLRAEATAIYGFNMKGTAADFYEQGVRLSFEQWGATGVDSYLADESSVPALYKDPAGLNTYEKNLSAITVKWNEGASKEEKQERIITQKWIANWPLGNEAWADYRRTGYPKLLPATSEGNLSGGIVDSEKGARRMPYPSEEYTSNTENVQEAVNSYLGGPDNMATDVWWARK